MEHVLHQDFRIRDHGPLLMYDMFLIVSRGEGSLQNLPVFTEFNNLGLFHRMTFVKLGVE
jgi:hypothetical protein